MSCNWAEFYQDRCMYILPTGMFCIWDIGNKGTFGLSSASVKMSRLSFFLAVFLNRCN